MKTVFIKLTDTGFTQDEIDAATARGEVSGTALRGGSSVGEVIGSAALFSNFDPSGAMMKLSQILQLFKRVRFIHVKFGVSLNAFLIALDPGFVLSSKTANQTYLF